MFIKIWLIDINGIQISVNAIIQRPYSLVATSTIINLRRIGLLLHVISIHFNLKNTKNSQSKKEKLSIVLNQ